MNLIIKEQEIELKYSIRSLILYEEIIGETFQPTSTKNILTFLFCIILSSKKDIDIDYDDFLDYVDENPNIISEFTEWLGDIFKKQDITKKKQTTKKKVKK